jgi:cobalt-zinc-cadmium efflux system protein
MLMVALLGLLVNLTSFFVLRGGEETNVNIQGRLFTCLATCSARWNITRRSGHLLLEGTPETIDRAEIERDLVALPGVAGVHHIHVWSLTSGRPLATLHLRLAPGADLAAVHHR